MYQSYYGLSAKPFQLKPDPQFFFGSRGHKRAMAYLEYGLSQGEGFIVITGDVGAGKTTLVRSLFCKLESEKIQAAQIVNTNLDADDTLKMVVAAFGIPNENDSKASLLTRLEQFLRQCDQKGKRALLIVDEAQNLSPHAVEELRMLSNFQTAEKSLLQIFLLGQPEFRRTLLSRDMQQLQQRVIATYHLGPLDALETKDYIEHRLHTVGWKGDPSLSEDAFFEIYNFTGGIPRKINALCDRLFLMGYLEERHNFGSSDVNEVIGDIQQELTLPLSETAVRNSSDTPQIWQKEDAQKNLENMDERLFKMENSVISVLDLLKRILSRSNSNINNLTK
ncbi:XrtA/PEP-CTERM system-associated ATPase [Candidatus Nitrotoga sp. 1052]|uniref:XrtA/PEP-CTERM system-associated ATPase n=1 Tax=Candidatus Nitrotoga sp. 1052 TaxID=2886964 RepID=UPI001EF4B702|nr:XrtA/PEP-CTERM system-associated ATPase [Candidatus Nitrotoga sp. 1052]CAH1079372.1 ATPase [Candidatus Nitrotoga sp. 1052]